MQTSQNKEKKYQKESKGNKLCNETLYMCVCLYISVLKIKKQHIFQKITYREVIGWKRQNLKL